MLADIVIDTNVFLHAVNNIEPRQQSCILMLNLLNDGTTQLCVDEGFSLEESKNRSHIGQEYITHLRAGSIGYALVGHLARSGRVSILPRRVPATVSRHITTQIRKGPDRTYVYVAYNSMGKTFASHDFNDIPTTVRTRIQRAIAVRIVDAAEAAISLQ